MTDSLQKANAPIRCKLCGAVLSGSRLDGLCPACTWGALSDADQDEVDPLPVRVASHSLFQIPGHVVVEEIARGGMGIVYRARQVQPERDVALKMLLPHQLGSAGMRERFRVEVQAIASLEHPAILPVHQVGEHDGLPYFTMKLATGGTLSSRADRYRGKFREIAELMVTLVEAVRFAHERGVLHRDLKPGNILFDEQGRGYVSDFGLAKLVSVDSDLTRSVDFLGTPSYVAPEVAARSARQSTIASDIYGLGAILYELLAGRPPFEAESVPALLRKIAEDEPRPPSAVKSDARNPKSEGSKVPRDLEIICLKCLAKEPSRRYASAHELADDLQRWLGGRTIRARPATRLERMRAWTRRNPALAVVSSVLVVALLGTAALEYQANRRLKQALAESLLAQAQLQRSSSRAGQRFETLSLVGRATKILRAASDSTARRMKAPLRTEMAAALALPDLRPVARWRAHVAHFENESDFTADLEHYVVPTSDGGFALFATADHKPRWHLAGITNNPVVKLRISPDGRWVAARFQDGHAELHATFTNAPPRRWSGEHNLPATFTFAPDGEDFAVAPARYASFSQITVLDLATGITRATVPVGKPVLAMAFDADGARLAVTADALTVWRLADTNRLWSAALTLHASAIAWSPDGKRLAVALDRRSGEASEALKGDPILSFDTLSGRQQALLAEVGTRVERLAFHPDGNSLVAATWQNNLLWISMQLDGFNLVAPGAQRTLQFAPDGRRLAYAPSKEELGLLQVAAPTALREWRSTSPPVLESFSMAVSADGRWVVTGTGDHVQLWDAERREAVASRPLPAKAWWIQVLMGSRDDCFYYSGESFGVRRVELLRTNAPDGRRQLQFGHESLVSEPRGFTAFGFAADGRSLIVGESRQRTRNERVPPTIWLWPDADPARPRKLAEDFPLVGYSVVPGGRWAVSTDLVSPDLWIWDFETGQRVRSLGIPLHVGSEPAPNGRWLVTRTATEFAVWEVGSWRAGARWPVTATELTSSWMVVSPDSRLLATAMVDGRITLRVMPAGGELVTLTPPRPMRLSAWRFSPDNGRLYVLTATGHVFEWDLVELRRELAKLDLDW